MYTKSGQPEQVKHIWDYITQSSIKPDATLYTSILSTIADWANSARISDDRVETPMLELGRKVHKHLNTSRLRYIINDYFYCFYEEYSY